MLSPKIGELRSRPAWAKSKTLFSKRTRVKRAGGMAQGIEHLPSEYKALSSNPKTKKEKRRG
jgi:hypothetical protein